jgi:plastocyanin
MIRKRTIGFTTLALAALAALALASTAPAHVTATTITISHHTQGCHVWSIKSGPLRPNLSVVVKSGATIKFVNNDVMPQKLVQTNGPKLRLTHPGMNKMASTTTVKLSQKGTYRFTTKPGEDYHWAAAMKTTGEDNVLRLTVRVR